MNYLGYVYHFPADSKLPVAPTHLMGEGEGSPPRKSQFPSAEAIKAYIQEKVLKPSIEMAHTYNYSDDEFTGNSHELHVLFSKVPSSQIVSFTYN